VAAEPLRTEVSDGVLTVTIDRPESKNALSLAMRQRLEALCAEVDGRDDIDVMILTGVDPVFCAGADTKEIARLGASLPPTNPGAALRAVDKPVICAVNGPCVTGGLEVALSCDFIVASERATFADTHARLGVLPRWGLSALLPAAVGVRRAKEMTSTGRFVTASEALQFGLANRVVAHEELAAAALAIAQSIRGANQPAVRASFGLYDRGAGAKLAESLDTELEVATGWVVDLSNFGQRPG
jgi:enoyl-CoA hydratase